MNIATFVAQAMSLLYLGAAVAAIRGVIDFDKILKDFEQSKGLTFITGLITLIIGLLIVTLHNVWAKDWTVLITLIGWISLIKGFMFIAFPDSLKMFKGMYKNTQVWGVFLLALAAVFGYFGFGG